MHATALIAAPIVSQPSVLLPKQPFEPAYTSHLATFSAGKIICISAQCLELGPSARFFKVPTVGAPSGVVLGNYIGNSCMNKRAWYITWVYLHTPTVDGSTGMSVPKAI